MFRFYTETEIFDISLEPKQTEDQLKQFDMEHILVFFQEILGFFSVCLGMFRISLFRLFCFYTETRKKERIFIYPLSRNTISLWQQQALVTKSM